MSTQIEKLLYSINDAAYALSVSRGTIYREINAGRLHFLRHGKRRFISRQALESWIRDRELESGSRFGIRQLQTEADRDCA